MSRRTSPWVISSASALPAPPEWVTQIASHSHSRLAVALSPISGIPSGVKENIPLKLRASFARPTAGNSERVSSAAVTKSSGVKGVMAGWTSPPGGRIASGSTTRGSWR